MMNALDIWNRKSSIHVVVFEDDVSNSALLGISGKAASCGSTPEL